MSPDSKYAIGLLGFLVLVISMKQFCALFLEVLLGLTREGATIVLLGMVAFAYSKKMLYTSLVLSLISVYLLKDIWVVWPRSDARRLHLDIGRDQARFDPSTSVDLQWANGSASYDSPSMLERHGDAKMLVFPPSDQILHDMCG
jgi:hypothetical protein